MKKKYILVYVFTCALFINLSFANDDVIGELDGTVEKIPIITRTHIVKKHREKEANISSTTMREKIGKKLSNLKKDVKDWVNETGYKENYLISAQFRVYFSTSSMTLDEWNRNDNYKKITKVESDVASILQNIENDGIYQEFYRSLLIQGKQKRIMNLLEVVKKRVNSFLKDYRPVTIGTGRNVVHFLSISIRYFIKKCDIKSKKCSKFVPVARIQDFRNEKYTHNTIMEVNLFVKLPSKIPTKEVCPQTNRRFPRLKSFFRNLIPLTSNNQFFLNDLRPTIDRELEGYFNSILSADIDEPMRSTIFEKIKKSSKTSINGTNEIYDIVHDGTEYKIALKKRNINKIILKDILMHIIENKENRYKRMFPNGVPKDTPFEKAVKSLSEFKTKLSEDPEALSDDLSKLNLKITMNGVMDVFKKNVFTPPKPPLPPGPRPKVKTKSPLAQGLVLKSTVRPALPPRAKGIVKPALPPRPTLKVKPLLPPRPEKTLEEIKQQFFKSQPDLRPKRINVTPPWSLTIPKSAQKDALMFHNYLANKKLNLPKIRESFYNYHPTKRKNISYITDINKIADFVGQNILLGESAKEREKRIKHWLNVAQYALKIGNLDLVEAIYGNGLNLSVIQNYRKFSNINLKNTKTLDYLTTSDSTRPKRRKEHMKKHHKTHWVPATSDQVKEVIDVDFGPGDEQQKFDKKKDSISEIEKNIIGTPIYSVKPGLKGGHFGEFMNFEVKKSKTGSAIDWMFDRYKEIKKKEKAGK